MRPKGESRRSENGQERILCILIVPLALFSSSGDGNCGNDPRMTRRALLESEGWDGDGKTDTLRPGLSSWVYNLIIVGELAVVALSLFSICFVLLRAAAVLLLRERERERERESVLGETGLDASLPDYGCTLSCCRCSWCWCRRGGHGWLGTERRTGGRRVGSVNGRESILLLLLVLLLVLSANTK